MLSIRSAPKTWRPVVQTGPIQKGESKALEGQKFWVRFRSPLIFRV
jgi:hypothetical protein